MIPVWRDREFLEAKRLKPDDWFLRNEIVGAYTSRGRYELAVEELREATGRAALKGYPHEALGRILLDLGRLDEAVLRAKSRRRTRSRIRSGTYELGPGTHCPG